MAEGESNYRTEDEKLLTTFRQLAERYLKGEELSKKELSLLYRASQHIDEKGFETNSNEITHVSRIILKTLRGKMNIPKKRSINMWNFRKYVAAITIIVLVSLGIYITHVHRVVSQPTLVEIIVDKKARIVTLPDGSIVHMNMGSQLIYDKKTYNINQRKVELNGEAFFDVAKNPKKPFMIQSASMSTIVLGTSFNVKAYSELKEKVISVREGLVEIRDENQLLGILGANQQLAYDISLKKYEIEESDWIDAAGWIDGNLIFNSTGAAELKLKLKQYFNLDLKVEGNTLDGIRLRSIFASDVKIDDVMKSICELYGLKYRKHSNEIILYK